jgi:hypothetical protein
MKIRRQIHSGAVHRGGFTLAHLRTGLGRKGLSQS